MKTCSTCGVSKPLSEFGRRKSALDGHRGQCRKCLAVYHSEWRSDHPEKRQAHVRNYVLNNPEKFKDSQARYKSANREKILESACARAHARYWADPEKYRGLTRTWMMANPEYVLAANAKRRALLAGATIGEVSYEAILERDGLWCYLCEADVESDDIHFDHVVPLSKGGEHSMDNIKVTHAKCNLRKGARVIA